MAARPLARIDVHKGGKIPCFGFPKLAYRQHCAVPVVLGEMLQDKDATKSTRVMNAMLRMSKLDISELKRACNSTGEDE